MSLPTLLLAASLPVAAALVALALRVDRRRAAAPPLAPAPERRKEAAEVTVLLPARDEEENLEACVRSLLAQTSVPRIVVIDDSSADRTGEIAGRLAAEDDRVEAVEAPPLPTGWKGKVHALETGLAAVDTPWLLSTDADTRHHPDLLARAVATAEARGLDSLSLAGWQQARGPGENLVTPVVFAFLDALLGDWRRAAAGETEVANGQFFLVRSEALRAIGGFASLRSAALDDVTLARNLRAARFRHGFFRAPEMLRVRMYRHLDGTFRGWRRNLGAIFAGRRREATGVLAVLAVPAVLLAGQIVAGAWTAAFALWAGGAAASVIARRSSRHPPAYGLLYPLDAAVTALCFGLGLRDAAKGRLAAWKGRPVRLDRPDEASGGEPGDGSRHRARRSSRKSSMNAPTE